MSADRQPLPVACRHLWMVPGLLVYLASPAYGQVEVSIVVTPTPTVAPARLTLTASVVAPDPILDRQWTGLWTVPFCNGSSCPLSLPTGACRNLSLEVTTLSGELHVGDGQACALGKSGAAPPRAELFVTRRGGGFEVRGQVDDGAEDLLAIELWIDGEQHSGGLVVTVPEDQDCHVADLLAFDRGGLYAVAQRIFCGDPDAPRLHLGAPDHCPAVGEPLQVCSQGAHPLGLDLLARTNNFVLDGCTTPASAPAYFARRYVEAIDPTGRVARASVFTCTRPNDGSANLFFLAPIAPLTAQVSGPWRLTLTTGGGVPPFVGEVVLSNEGGVVSSQTLDGLDTPLGPLPAEVGLYQVAVQLTDGRGLEARTQGTLTLTRDAPDAGVPPDGGVRPDAGPGKDAEPSSALSTSAGCQDVSGSGGSLAWCLLLFLSLRRRR